MGRNIITLLFTSIAALALSAGAITNFTCPLTKSDCDASQHCHWSADDRCMTSTACVLAPNRQACEANTWDCVWKIQFQRCERKQKLTFNDSACRAKSQTSCAQATTCFWSTLSNQCITRPTIILSLADDLGNYDIGFNNPRARTKSRRSSEVWNFA